MSKPKLLPNLFIIEKLNGIYQIQTKTQFNKKFPDIKNSKFAWKNLLMIEDFSAINKPYLWVLCIDQNQQLKGICRLEWEVFQQLKIKDILRVVLMVDVSTVILVTNDMYFYEKKPQIPTFHLIKLLNKKLGEEGIEVYDHLVAWDMGNGKCLSVKTNDFI